MLTSLAPGQGGCGRTTVISACLSGGQGRTPPPSDLGLITEPLQLRFLVWERGRTLGLQEDSRREHLQNAHSCLARSRRSVNVSCHFTGPLSLAAHDPCASQSPRRPPPTAAARTAPGLPAPSCLYSQPRQVARHGSGCSHFPPHVPGAYSGLLSPGVFAETHSFLQNTLFVCPHSLCPVCPPTASPCLS